MTDSEKDAILGIDPGEKRIGLAIAHRGTNLATGLNVINYKNKRQFAADLGKIIDEENVGLVVVGLPLNMNGSEGDSAKMSRRLADIIMEELGIPVEFVDERLSTEEALKLLRETGKKFGKVKGAVDMVAAAGILQSYLDAKKP